VGYAVTAMIGVLFSAAGVYKIQLWMTASNASGSYGLMRSMLVDHFAIYFFYLFLGGHSHCHIDVGQLLETEHENRGEYYALMLLSVVA